MFDAFTLSDEHLALQEAARRVVADKVTPYAAEVDEAATFPQAGYDALVAWDATGAATPAGATA